MNLYHYASKLIESIQIFSYSYLAFFISGIIIILSYEKAAIHLYINSLHTPFLDVFFKYWTFTGDGLFILILLLPISLMSIRTGAILLVSYLLSGAVSQIFKFIIHLPRPVAWFENPEVLNFVEGVKVYSWNSMPSGHTSTAFALFFIVALASRHRLVQALCFIGAILTGFSRVYLNLHFFEDIVFGSLAGITITVPVLWFFDALTGDNRYLAGFMIPKKFSKA